MSGFLVLVGLVIYPLVAHVFLMLGVPQVAIGSLITMAVLSLVLMFRSRRVTVSGVLLALCVIALAGADIAKGSMLVLFLPPVLANLGLMWFFGQTLRSGETPLIERLMHVEYGHEPAPELIRHARIVTWIWTVFFGLIVIASVLLAAFAPMSVWSWFVNVGIVASVVVLFFLQQIHRMVRFRHHGRVMPWVVFARLARIKPTDPAHPLFGTGKQA